jgi:hypothetical protein
LVLSDAEKNTAMEKEASEAILAAVCDATFWLSEDGDIIHKSSVKLEAILGSGLAGTRLSNFMVKGEQSRFHDAIEAGRVSRPRNSVVRSVPVRFMHPTEQSIITDLFVVDRRVGPDAELKACGSTQAGFFVGLRLNQICDMGSPEAETMGSPAAETPVAAARIRAASLEWAGVVSNARTSNPTCSERSLLPRPQPRMPPPPHPGVVTQANLPNYLSALREWAPDIFDEIFEEMQKSHDEVCAAAESLEETAWQDHFTDMRAQVADLLLVGVRLSSRWPRLTEPWREVVFMTTGAQPTSLTTFNATDGDSHRMTAWRLPSFSHSLQWPPPHMWEMSSPQYVYAQARAQLTARVDRSHKCWISTQQLRL